MAGTARCVVLCRPARFDDLRKALQNVRKVIGLHQEIKELTVRIESQQLHHNGNNSHLSDRECRLNSLRNLRRLLSYGVALLLERFDSDMPGWLRL